MPTIVGYVMITLVYIKPVMYSTLALLSLCSLALSSLMC